MMTISTSDISAIVITRGDVPQDVERIVDTLPYDEVIVHESTDRGCMARFDAIAQARNPYIYFQDDDIVFTQHHALVAFHNKAQRSNRQPDSFFTSNMPDPWWTEQYADKGMALVGAGSIVPRDLPWAAFGRYLVEHPCDDAFLTYCDVVHGVLTPYVRIDLGYEILPCASAVNRIHRADGAAQRKADIIGRALEIRARS